MFFSQVVLAKKGPLGKVWLAAHWDRKLSKKDVLSANIVESVAVIKKPHKGLPYALRMSGHLLLGVVRIYARKVKYLMTDCSDALVKIKMAFRPSVSGQSTMVDMPQEAQAAQVGHITMTTNFEDVEEISLPETITSDDFFDMAHTIRSNLTTLPQSSLDDSMFASQGMGGDFNAWDDDEGFMHEPEPELVRGAQSSASSSRMATPLRVGGLDGDEPRFDLGDDTAFQFGGGDLSDFAMGDGDAFGGPPLGADGMTDPLKRAAILGAERVFAGTVPDARAQKRKRLASVQVDNNTVLSSAFIKNQLKDTRSTLREPEDAPATKRAMWEQHRRRQAGVEALFSNPCVPGLAKDLAGLFDMSATPDSGHVSAGAEIADFRRGGADDEGFSGIDMDGMSAMDLDGFDGGSFQADGGDGGFDGLSGFGLPEEEGFDTSSIGGDHHPASNYTDRTESVKGLVARRFEETGDKMSFFDLVEGRSRRAVAGTFFEFLVLKKRDIIDVSQKKPYADITITKGPMW